MLLQNEGHLLHGCIWSALSALKRSNSAERGPLYAALFTYSIGLERLLKVSLILDHCIVRIRESAGGRVLWQHPDYHHGRLEIRQKAEPVRLRDGRTLTVDVLRDGEIQAAFENVTQARRYINKLGVRAEIVA